MNRTIAIPALILFTACGFFMGGYYLFATGALDMLVGLCLLMPRRT